jgi:HK97 family phage major capsid protein
MSLTASAKKSREKRAGILENAGKLITAAAGEDRDLSTDERAKFDGMHDEADTLLVRITDLEKQIDRTTGLDQVVRSGVELDDDIDAEGDGASITAEESRSLEMQYTRNWIAGGHGSPRINDAQRAAYYDLLADADMNLRQKVGGGATVQEMRAMGAGAANLGLETVPEGFFNTLTEAKLAFGGMLGISSILNTASGNDIPFPHSDDTGNEGEIIAENAAHNELDVATGATTIEAYMYSSKIVLASIQLTQDSAFDINSWLARKLAERLARIQNRHYTVGDGAGKPNGVVTASAVGETAALVAAITHAEIVNLKHSVDPSYRNGALFQFHDQTLRFIKGLVDGDNRPLWQGGIAVGEPDKIDGDPYQINQHMATMAAGADVMTYGDHKSYYIRQVGGVSMLRLVERYAEKLQIGFLAFQRTDGDLIDAGTGPVKKLRMAP